MDTIISSDHARLCDAFWERFIEAVESCSAGKSEIYIGLSGGSSLDIFYSHFGEHFSEISEISRKKIRFALLDERVVPLDHPDSNMRQLREKFLSGLLALGVIEEGQIIGLSHDLSSRMQGSETKRNVAIQVSESGLRTSLMCRTDSIGCSHSEVWLPLVAHHPSQGRNWDIAHEYSTRVPRIDIGLFGVGPDGHIASLFPGHLLLQSTESCYLEMIDSPKPPAHRITVSPQMIRDMKYAFIAFMCGKEEVYIRFLDDGVSIEDCPAKMVKKVKNLVVISDIEGLTDEK